ncbi:germinal-center associated nuclear protein [Anastrepha obliqua]|uniref:germinal-center associated nuclear protein n=1 Tax=Anastrepha obliqua TaxID=95512 RepID=UPI00240A250C|nr:germinal-center associated nuclear protein [Anastrepha obliqua]
MSSHIRGTCELFCPEGEAKLRIKERLLHFYELKNGEKNVPGKLVKAFARSAAGVKGPRAKDLRTERCLQKTVEYLLKDIILDKRKPYNFIYDFVFDRLRSVRQEVVMQNYNARQTLKLLEPMVMFLAYSRYRLCEEHIDNFDPKICDQHLQECLKRALCCYDDSNVNSLNLNELNRRNFVEAMYLLFNLETTEALNRAMSLPDEVRKSERFDLAYQIAISYYQGNFYRVLAGIQKLPHILSAITALKLQILRRKVYLVFAHAYNCKLLVVPSSFLSKLVLYERADDLLADCEYYNIKVNEDKSSFQFLKSDFKLNAAVLREKRERFVEEKIEKIYLPETLLLKRI